nr:auxin transporter-like protein 2 [Tanacetum cinerariifolium]
VGVVHSGPKNPVLYFTGATNILYTFGGHAVTVLVLSRPDLKIIIRHYMLLFATFYVFTLTLPSACAMY